MIEKQVSRGIIRTYFEKLDRNLELDVAIVGGGPSGIVAAYYMAKAGLRVALFDRKLSPGGGMWGGAMMFNQIVVQREALGIIEDFGIRYEPYEDELFTVDSIESTSALLYKAVHEGATLFNCYSVEDVVFKDNAVSGVVVNWTPVLREGLHVDPLNIMARFVVDGTGHDSEMCRVVARKMAFPLPRLRAKWWASGRSMWWKESGSWSRAPRKSIPVSMSAAWLPRQSRARPAWDPSSAGCSFRAKRWLMTSSPASRGGSDEDHRHHLARPLAGRGDRHSTAVGGRCGLCSPAQACVE